MECNGSHILQMYRTKAASLVDVTTLARNQLSHSLRHIFEVIHKDLLGTVFPMSIKRAFNSSTLLH